MKAVILKQHGGIEGLQLTESAKPDLTPGNLIVRVRATSVNPVDVKMRKAAMPFSRALPDVLHGDVAGVVEAVGEGVVGFAVGDRVYGLAGGVVGTEGGALAEYMSVDARLVAAMPKTLSFEEAAALPLVALTAWETLVDRLRVAPGQRVLIHGGLGGVGHVAVQIAGILGAEVATTVSSDAAAETARQLGASHTINYKTEDVASYVMRITGGRGFDAVFDTVGGDNLRLSMEAVRAGGAVASIATGGNHDMTTLYIKGASLHSELVLLPMITGEGREQHHLILERLARLVDLGRLRPLIDECRFTLEQVGAAHAHLESGAAVGKIVVTVK